MSTDQYSNPRNQARPTYVVNPRTNRAIQVGKPTWRRLVKLGVIPAQEFNDPNELCEYKDADAEQKIEEMNEMLPPMQHAVRGRGKYKGKIVKRSKSMAHDTVGLMSKAMSKVLKINMDQLSNSNRFEEELERLTIQELNNPTPKNPLAAVRRGQPETPKRARTPVPKRNPRARTPAPAQQQWLLAEDPEEDESSDGDYGDWNSY